MTSSGGNTSVPGFRPIVVLQLQIGSESSTSKTDCLFVITGVGDSRPPSSSANVEDEPSLRGIISLPRRYSAEFTLSVWHSCRTRAPRGPDASRKQNATSHKLYEMSLSISSSPLGAKVLPSVCSVCRWPHQQEQKKRKQRYYPLPLVIASALFKWKVSAAAFSLYLLFIVQKSTVISGLSSDIVWSE